MRCVLLELSDERVIQGFRRSSMDADENPNAEINVSNVRNPNAGTSVDDLRGNDGTKSNTDGMSANDRNVQNQEDRNDRNVSNSADLNNTVTLDSHPAAIQQSSFLDLYPASCTPYLQLICRTATATPAQSVSEGTTSPQCQKFHSHSVSDENAVLDYPGGWTAREVCIFVLKTLQVEERDAEKADAILLAMSGVEEEWGRWREGELRREYVD